MTGLVALTGLALPAQAEISGSCKASINGTDVASISSENVGQAVLVKEGGSASVTLDASSPMNELQIFVEAAGVRIPAVTRSVSGTSVRETVPVDQYARYGVGLYKVIGEGRGGGQTCAGAALVKVEGNPLETTAGVAGAAVAGVGALGVLGASGAAAMGGGKGLRLSGMGLVGGLLAGLGGLVLAQQYGVAYPSLGLTAGGLGTGVVSGGVVLPSLFSLFRP
jgi:hypothetical protein